MVMLRILVVVAAALVGAASANPSNTLPALKARAGGGELSRASIHQRSLPVAVADAAPVAIEEDISRDVAAPEVLLLTGGAVLNLLGAFWRIHGNGVKFLIAGAAAGVVSRTCTSPLEVIATMQMCGAGSQKASVIYQLKELWADEGVKGFWKGNGANCLKVAPTRAIQFAVFERIKFMMLKHQTTPDGKPKSLSPMGRLFAGGLAGMVASLFVYPLEVVKTMLTLNPGVYKGIITAFMGAYNAGGIGGLYRGLPPTLVAMFPYVGIEFMAYECLKVSYLTLLEEKRVLSGAEKADKPHVLVMLLIGAGAGAAAQASAHPLDVVRKRLQLQGTPNAEGTLRPVLYNNMFDGLYLLAKNEGKGALYRGLRAGCAATIPSTAVTYIVYEFMKTVLGLKSL